MTSIHHEHQAYYNECILAFYHLEINSSALARCREMATKLVL